MDGYIKLHRKILDNPIVCKDADHFSVWLYLLLNATHKEYPSLFQGEKIILQPGQLITGRFVIAKQFGISDSKVKRILICFENDHQIDRQRSNQNSLITILNWSSYQQRDQQDDQPVTSQRPASDQPVTTYKNVKNVKNVINKTYSKNPELNSSLIEFMEFRKKIKSPMTDRAVELLIINLNKLSKEVPEQIAILNQSIMSGWKGVFALKEERNTQDKPKAINKFNNAPQRDYTPDKYAEIERALRNKGL